MSSAQHKPCRQIRTPGCAESAEPNDITHSRITTCRVSRGWRQRCLYHGHADRTAIVASIELGYTYDQIALVLDKPSAEAARLAVRRALVRLGKEMSLVEEMTRGAQ